ncbi:VWA domain-containing protein [uncultured Vibrio sp.]|uniref:VWA domain-containing protein n=1 Tax=uncultured Vibrio sp. TaxID=114054 RepID=UPI0025F9F300|nr:VWA domain-containing protein [uncultured Vibrio sp.]
MFNEMTNSVELANTWVLWMLPLPVVIYLFAKPYRQYTESVSISNLHALTAGEDKRQYNRAGRVKKSYGLLAIIWLGLLLTAAHPEKVIQGPEQEVSVRDMLLVLDISGSMAIRDMQIGGGEPNSASRMEVMQKAVTEFIRKREYDNIGLVVFGSQALPLTPISQDHQALLEQVNEMVPGMAGPQTSIGDAIGVAIRKFRQMDAVSKSQQIDGDATSEEEFNQERMMVLLTDGLDTSSELPPRVALRLAEKQQIVIHSIAFGDMDDKESSHSIDTELLKEMAQKTNGSFHYASRSLTELQQVYDSIDEMVPRKMKLVRHTEREDIFFFPLLLSFIVAMALFALSTLKGDEK